MSMMNNMQKIQDAFDALTVEDQQQGCVNHAKFLAEGHLNQKSIEALELAGREASNVLASFGTMGDAMASLAPSPAHTREPDGGFWRTKSMIYLMAESSAKLKASAGPDGPLSAKEIMAQRRIHAFLETCYSAMSPIA